jgi:hypothetical protein
VPHIPITTPPQGLTHKETNGANFTKFIFLKIINMKEFTTTCYLRVAPSASLIVLFG